MAVEMTFGANEIRVVIVDDHILFAEAVRTTLEAKGMEVVAVVGSGGAALEAVASHHPDLVLVDIGLPDQSGVELGRMILRDWPATKLIAVTAMEDGKLAQKAIRVGFQGYLTKNVDMHQFISSVRSVLAGSTVMPQQLVARRDRSELDVQIERLTGRELEVLALLARGFSSHNIAGELHLAPNTVRTHVQNILTKLQVHSRLEAAAFAVHHGLAGSGGGVFRTAL
ncbi:MAG TPA: response regulator transcription factor [Actinomycetota bacterium]|jgi:two-component system nitrate/nitrite response regulator NarL|nr:response regulator transcription factor [Actinomycetota bacterium]